MLHSPGRLTSHNLFVSYFTTRSYPMLGIWQVLLFFRFFHFVLQDPGLVPGLEYRWFHFLIILIVVPHSCLSVEGKVVNPLPVGDMRIEIRL